MSRKTIRKTSSQLRAERLSALLGYPPLTVEGWEEDHLRYCHKSAKKRRGKKLADVTYKSAIEGGRDRENVLSTRMLHIRVAGGTKLIRFLKYIRGWYDSKSGQKKALIEVMIPFSGGERETIEVTLV